MTQAELDVQIARAAAARGKKAVRSRDGGVEIAEPNDPRPAVGADRPLTELFDRRRRLIDAIEEQSASGGRERSR